jgi:6-phospho-3-hexuloisomerase
MDFSAWIRADLDELSQRVVHIDPLQAEALGEAALDADRIFIAGLGRSGLVMRMAALRLMQLGLTVHVVGDATTPAIAAGDLLIIGSGSGETGGAVHLARRARSAGASLLVVTARPDSTLGQMADVRLVVPGWTPKHEGEGASQLPMATVLEQAFLVVMDCLVAWLADRLGQTDEMMMARHANLE